MTDLALRRQVAEGLGWTEIRLHPAKPDHLAGHCPPSASGVRIGALIIPAYETDIAAAWELLEEMIEGKDVCDVSIGVYPVTDDDPDGAYCEIIRWKNYERIPLQSAPKAPAAICKAWLKYKEQQDDR